MHEKAATEGAIERIRKALGRIIRGKGEAIDLVLTSILAGGHVLLEDVPGVGKTTLAKALAGVLNLEFSRVQFTPDLLPTDILGANILNPKEGTFSFHKGPVFTHLLLADEINRASPRTQSALLEAMSEQQVTLDGVTRHIEDPFFVIATQNPVDYQGTYPLPEAQLDRFLTRVSMGYPAFAEEMTLVFDRQLEDPLAGLTPVLDIQALLALRTQVRGIRISEDVCQYLLRIVHATRNHQDLELGASPRATLALFRAAQARALLNGRDWAGPSDIQRLAHPVLVHRLMPSIKARYGGKSTVSIVSEILEQTEVPR